MFVRGSNSHLMVVDVQERLVPSIHETEQVIGNVSRLIRYADILNVPTTFTEHMPERIGSFLPALRGTSQTNTVCLQKFTFSSWREPAIAKRLNTLRDQQRHQIIIAGMETHVCVMQTALDLIDQDFDVFLVSDAVGSRTTQNRDAAITRLSKAGATIITQEMVAFEWLERGDAPEFKDVLSVLK